MGERARVFGSDWRLHKTHRPTGVAMSSSIRPAESPVKSPAESSVSPHVSSASPRVAPSPASRIAAVSAEIPIEIHGSRKSPTDGHPIEAFQEETVSVIVFPHGGVVRLAAEVSKGQMVAVTNLNTQRGMLCRVVNVRTYPNLKHYVEVEFAQPVPGFWGVNFPQEVSSAAKPAPVEPQATEPQEVSPATTSSAAERPKVSPLAKSAAHEASEPAIKQASTTPIAPSPTRTIALSPPPAPEFEIVASRVIADEPNLVHVSADDEFAVSESASAAEPAQLKAEDFWGASFPAEMIDAVAAPRSSSGPPEAPIPSASIAAPASAALQTADAANAEPIDLPIDKDETWSELLSQLPTRPEKPAPARPPELSEEDLNLESVAPTAQATIPEFLVTKTPDAETSPSESAGAKSILLEPPAFSPQPPENFNPSSPAALKELERLALGHLDTNPVQRQNEPLAQRPPKINERTKQTKRGLPARVSPTRLSPTNVSTDLADLQQPYGHQPASSAAALHSFTSSSGGTLRESNQPAAAPGTEKLTFGNFLKDPEPRTSTQRVFSERSDVMSASLLAPPPPLHAAQASRSSSNFFLLAAAVVIMVAAGGLIVLHSVNDASSKPAVVGKPWAEQTPAPPGNLKPNAEPYELPNGSAIETSSPAGGDSNPGTPETGLEVELTTAVTPPSKNGTGAAPKQAGRRTAIPALNLSAPTSDSDSNGTPATNTNVGPPPVISGGSALSSSGDSLTTYAASANPNIPRPAVANPLAAIPAARVVTQPRLIWSASPIYPTLAKQANIQGDVKLEITINESGHVTKTKAISGPALLQQPAINAVRDWKYEPSTLDGKPVPTQLVVTVQFRR
jgi:TonB family protein